MQSYLITSTGLLFLLTLFFMVAVLLRRKLNRQNLSFSFFAASVGFWSFSYLLWQLAETAGDAEFWTRMLVFGSIFIPVTYLDFITKLTGYRRPWLTWTGYLIAAIMAGFNATGPWIVAEVGPASSFAFWPKAGPLFPAYLANFGFFVLYSFGLLVGKYRRSSPQERNQLKYLLIGTAFGFLGGSTNFFLWIDIPIPPLGQGLGVLYILGIGYSVVKYRLLEFNDLALRMVFSLVLAIVVSGLFASASLPILQVEGLTGGPDMFARYWMTTCAFTLLLFLVIPSLNLSIDRALQSVFQVWRNAYREQLKELASRLHDIEDEAALFLSLIESLESSIPANRSALYYRGDFDADYRLRGIAGDFPNAPRSISGEALRPLSYALTRNKGPMLFGEFLQKQNETRNPFVLKPELRELFLKDDLLVPVSGGKVLDGFLLLGPRKDRRIYSEIDMTLLENICSEVALTLRSRQVERRANQVEKLVSLGTMAAGLAHELRNPLVSIKTMGSLINQPSMAMGDPGIGNGNGNGTPDSNFTQLVQRDINRISSIIENVAAFAENSEVSYAPVDINEVILKTREIQKPRMDQCKIDFSFERLEVPPVLGNFNQLVQVFINVFENALAAMDEAPLRRLEVRCGIWKREGHHDWVEIRVVDSGRGIPSDLLPKVFDPFVTTKATGSRVGKSGTGLGLAIVKRIIEAHNGAIDIDSKPGTGTRLRLGLPTLPTP